MIMSVSPQLLPSSYFQAAILWQCWHSLQHHSPRGRSESPCTFFSDRMSQGWKREPHMPGTLRRGGEWPWLFCHPVQKATECAKLATVALFLYPDCLSKVEMAFSGPEEGLCVDASRQTIITWEPETVLEYCRHFSWELHWNQSAHWSVQWAHILYMPLVQLDCAVAPVNQWLQCVTWVWSRHALQCTGQTLQTERLKI